VGVKEGTRGSKEEKEMGKKTGEKERGET